jgi:23S rRNA (adenine2503-C2)-methyltransferase
MVRRPHLRSLRLEDIEAWVARRGLEPYRANQIAGWLYNRPLSPVADMHNLPKPLREALEKDFDCSLPVVVTRSRSNDGTTKLLVGLTDERVVESVLIPRDERLTLCISSQVGCALDCKFCATATLGLLRNLDASEIVAQVMLARREAAPHPITNFVFMGMGEPLANYDQLVRAIEIMTARWGLGISPRRITVSTVGLVPQLERLVRDTNVHVAISLSAARDELRDRIMPVNRRWPLNELIGACKRLDLPRRKRITFEYVMLAGVNDAVEDADDVVRLTHGLAVKVNLIPFNPYAGCDFERASDERIEAFQLRLLAAGVHATVRKSRGRDIEAACGQLAAAAR